VTIFLDEIGELPAETQVALLRILQEREFERVGGTCSIRANVRLITATHRDLSAAICDRSFRSDLFYRINAFPVEMPPLRERPEGKRVQRIRRRTMDGLQSYPWARQYSGSCKTSLSVP
jgi:transcriptional regulator with GAF, ATPase, and Fis domain